LILITIYFIDKRFKFQQISHLESVNIQKTINRYGLGRR
jgi:hypothetical protein